jgi:two-component sensor histidine kinase
MIHDPISAQRPRAEMLHVAELLHRIGNDYTRAILFASLQAANASSNEARSALNEVVNHLQATAEMHRVLRPPSVVGSADLTDTIARLCRAHSEVSEFRRRRIDLLLAYDDPIEVDTWRCLAREPDCRGTDQQCLSTRPRIDAWADIGLHSRVRRARPLRREQ